MKTPLSTVKAVYQVFGTHDVVGRLESRLAQWQLSIDLSMMSGWKKTDKLER